MLTFRVEERVRHDRWIRLVGRITLFVALSLLPSAAHAGMYQSSFDDPAELDGTLLGDAELSAGALSLTTGPGENGALVLDNIDPGGTVDGFVASFRLYIGGGTAGDGFSLNYGPPSGLTDAEGFTTGFAISFDTFDDGFNDFGDYVGATFNGTLYAGASVDLRQSRFVDVTIKMIDAQVTVLYDDQLEISEDNIVWNAQSDWQFTLAASTSVGSDSHLIDDLVIVTFESDDYSEEFDTDPPPGASLFGTAVVATGSLRLTNLGTGNNEGTMILDDPFGGARVHDFQASFDARIGGGMGQGGNGFSFAFGDFGDATFGEEGPAGHAGLTVSFDTVSSGPGDVSDAAVVTYGGTTVVAETSGTRDIALDATRNFVIAVSHEGRLAIAHGSEDDTAATVVFLDVLIPGWDPQPGWRFGLGARGAMGGDRHWFDWLRIGVTACGDGVLDAIETCEDGNALDGDCCNSSCVFDAVSAPCDPPDACTVGNVCDGAGSCSAGTTRDCDDANVCTADSCDDATGCSYSNNSFPCDDGDVCTVGDQCSGGICTGAARDCDDGNLCTDDTCGSSGCENTANTLVCDDGDDCTENDVCSAGVCVSGTPKDCDDANDCTDDGCSAGVCENSPKVDGSGCVGAGASCMSDVCLAGSCTATPAPDGSLCDDGNECTTDLCASGVCLGTPRIDGVACSDDGDACTLDYCTAGVCDHPAAVAVCGDSTACNPESCDDGNSVRGDGCSVDCDAETTLTDDEQDCIGAVTKAALKVVTTQAKWDEGCVKHAAKGEEPFPDICMNLDLDAKVERATVKVDALLTDKCSGIPPFGLNDAASVSDAARDAAIALAHDLFGDSMNAGIFDAEVDSVAAKCQATVLKASHKLLPILGKEFLGCEKNSLSGRTDPQAVSAADLAGCLDDMVADPRGRFAKALTKIGASVETRCVSIPVPATFTGVCADASDFSACLGRAARCRACQAMSAIANVAADCDQIDDALANLSCGDGR